MPGRDSDISQLVTAEASVCMLSVLTLVTLQASAPGFGGLCHQEGGLLNSASAWEEIVGFLVTGGFCLVRSSPSVHLCGTFPQCSLPGFVAVCMLF